MRRGTPLLYLALALVTVLSCMPRADAPLAKSAPTTAASYAQEVVRLINVQRVKAGLPALVSEAILFTVAQVKADDMRSKGYFSHTSPTYGSPFAMLRRFGVPFRAAAENLAKGYRTPASVVAGWLGSSAHRSNILSKNLTHTGVGVAGDLWVEMFRQP